MIHPAARRPTAEVPGPCRVRRVARCRVVSRDGAGNVGSTPGRPVPAFRAESLARWLACPRTLASNKSCRPRVRIWPRAARQLPPECDSARARRKHSYRGSPFAQHIKTRLAESLRDAGSSPNRRQASQDARTRFYVIYEENKRVSRASKLANKAIAPSIRKHIFCVLINPLHCLAYFDLWCTRR